ncbi:MAG: excinuclease ABC subunit A, partial [Burkholderiaceae bacterium]
MSKSLKSNKLPQSTPTDSCDGLIRIRGARQHTLKNLNLDIRTNEMTVVTGPSGSGKSSLVFDTLFAEGQRRYVETFSAYARQFLDRMDKPAVDRVDGVPPAIAIDQTNPVRSSRSTVGTMTELNDHLKLLFARSTQLFDKQTAQPVQHDNADTIYDAIANRSAGKDLRLVVTFPVELPVSTTAEEVEQWLLASGFTRIHAQRDVAVKDLHSTHEVATLVGKAAKKVAAKKTAKKKEAELDDTRKVLDVVADRFKASNLDRARAVEALEVALKRGSGHMTVYVSRATATTSTQTGAAVVPPMTLIEPEERWQFSSGLHCPDSHIRYQKPSPSMFSFNSPVGACETCRGFGRVIGVDYGLVIPNDKLSLRGGAIK